MKYIIFMALVVALVTLLIGAFYVKKNVQGDKAKLSKYLRINLMIYVPIILLSFLILVPDMVYAINETGVESYKGIGLIAAALSTGMACIGCGYAVGSVGSSALGAVSENPAIMGRTMIFVGLAEGIAIYGMIISILILGQL